MVKLYNETIQVEVAPEVGGRIVSFVDRKSGYEFLWRNEGLPLRREQPGAEYDPNFFGGIDELLPNDIPEEIGGVRFPDHGEVWTAEFSFRQIDSASLEIVATLPCVQFEVKRNIRLNGCGCEVYSRITNVGSASRSFLWKLHPAVNIKPGDQIESDAERFFVADADWSRRAGDGDWNGETVPEFDDTTEFLYLDRLKTGSMRWRRGSKSFEVVFDLEVFPYVWYFASYGGFYGHHVALLEPCTAIPISVNEAAARGTCSLLEPGSSLETTYVYRGVVDED